MNTYLFLSITFFIISVLTANYKTKHLYSSLLNAFFIFVYLIITIMYFSADYFTGEGITQAVLFTLETGLQGAGFGEYIVLIAVSTFLFVLVVALSYLYLRLIKHRAHPKPKRIKGIVHNTFLFFAFLTHPFDLDLYSIYTSMHVKQSTDFDKYYKKPNPSLARTKDYNLVYIYAESLEKTYFDESIFPGLMSNLKELKKMSTEFTNINQVVATGWTIGGMTATQCAIPLFTTSQGNSMNGSDTFLSGATCMGDTLKSKGYHLAFMQGSSVNFSGIRQLHTTHKFDEVYGTEELQERIEDKNYKNGWGLYDDTLFPMVYEKFEELSKINKPFALFTATLDTHHPNGMTSKSCSDIPYDKGDNSILNAVHCSDRLVTQFIEKIQNSKYADKTLIVLTSDHLAMRNTATNLLKKSKRRDLFLIFDPSKKQYTPIDKAGSMLDVGPTVLSKLGIKTDIGLGRNLLREDSLFTAFDNFNKKLLSWRESILKLWQFATLNKSYDVNTTSMEMQVGGHTYKIPILAKIEDDRTITPFFEFDSPKKLYEYISEFSPTQKFIWIDQCKKINIFSDLNVSSNMCALQGSLSSSLKVKTLTNKIQKIKSAYLLKNSEYNEDLYLERMIDIQKMLVTRKLPAKKVLLVSSPMPVLNLIPSIIKTSTKNLQISRGLNLLTIDAHSGEFVTQHFDVFASETAANAFIKTIKPLIRQKKFWAIVAHDAISNTYSGYKRKLTELGFKLLPILNFRVAYIAHTDKYGNIQEYSNTVTLFRTIKMFFNPKTIDMEKNTKNERNRKIKLYGRDPSRFIAHAGGEIDAKKYTNSLEALNASNAKGFKLFELDIIETSDHVFVAAHDWKHWKKNTGYRGNVPPTLEDFKKYKIKDKYTPLDISDINDWFNRHTDAILITDKINKPLEFSQKFIDKNRLMMELFTWKAVEEGVSSGILSPMPTGSLLKTKDVLEKLDSLGIKDIAISRRMIYTHKALLKKISAKGIRMYAFHVNHNKGKDEKYVLCEESEYFYGMYADKWDFKVDLDCNTK